jgi:hypothetical protein
MDLGRVAGSSKVAWTGVLRRTPMRKYVLAAGLVALVVSSPASAATLIFTTPLSPEVPGATGSGSAQVTFNTDAQTLAITTNWTGLSGLTTVAHIHCCVTSPGTAGVAVTVPTLPGFPTGVSSGTYSTVLDLSLASTYNPGFMTNFGGGTIEGSQAALLGGLQSETAYLNIHTNAFPGGEIRGFLSPVPEPSTWAMMLFGFGAVGLGLRRRRQKLTVSYS